eukprot:3224995-Rhodomonas_salina.3
MTALRSWHVGCHPASRLSSSTCTAPPPSNTLVLHPAAQRPHDASASADAASGPFASAHACDVGATEAGVE